MWRRFLSRDASRAWQLNKVAAAGSPGEHYSMYRVRLRPSRNTFRRAVGYGTTAVVCFLTWETIAHWPLRNLHPELQEEIANEKGKVEPLFLSLPFTEKRVNPLPYSGSGEEWQGFIAFEKDEERRGKVKQELKLLVKKAAEQNPATKMLGSGGKEFRIGPSFLTFTYPFRPPPEFIRWGIELNDEGIELKTRTLDARTKAFIDRIIMPYPMISGAYAFAMAVIKQNVDAVTNYLGYTPVNKPFTKATIDPELAKALKQVEARQAAHGGPGSSPSPESRSSPSPSTSDSPTHSGDMRANTADSSRDQGKPVNKDEIPLYSTLLGKGSGPWQAFKENFARTWKPLHCYPPRGSLAVHGVVALDTTKGRIFIDVWAWYHPKACEFHRDSMVMRVRSFRPYQQVPLRA